MMEYMESAPQRNPGSGPEKLQKDFHQLQKIASVLREMGFRVIDDLITLDILKDPASEMSFPIVRDGVDGIRVSYSKRRGITVWFTNGFEDPNDEKRQAVQQRLKEEGLQ